MKGIQANLYQGTLGLKGPPRRFGAGVAALLTLVLLLPPLIMMVAVPRTASAAVGTPFPVTDTSDKHQSPRIGGKIVVWEDDRDGVSNIRAKNLETGQTFVVATGVSVKRKPVTNGSFIFWEDDRGTDSDIYGYEISSGTEFVLAGGAGDQRKPEIEGKTVVWQSKSANSGWQVHSVDLTSYDPASGQSPSGKLEATGGDTAMNPVISDQFIVWEETRDGSPGIYAKDRQTGEEIKVTSGFAVGAPAVSGNVVVWQETDGGTFDIFGKDLRAKNLETGQTFTVAGGSGDQVAPAISGKLVVWQDGPNDKADIRGKDLETGEEFLIAGGDGKPHNNPAINGDTVVWQDERLSETTQPDGSTTTDVRLDIVGADLDVAPAAPKALKATGSLGGIALKWNANTEADLAGYNVYRSDSADGAYTKLNDALLTATSYDDAQAPKGSKSYYQVKAVDDTQKESAKASASSAAHASSDLGLTAGSGTIKVGETLSFSGKLSSGGKDLSGKDVTLLQRQAGSKGYTPTDNQPAPTGADGGFSVEGIKPGKTTFYRASFAGEPDAGVQSSISGPERVNVKLPASLDLSPGRAKLVVGQSTALSGKLSSEGNGLSGERVLLLKKAAGDKRFSRVPEQPSAGVLTGSDGSYRLGGINPRKNTVYRAVFRGGPELQREVSAPKRVDVKARVSANVGTSNSRVSIGGRVITARAGLVKVTIKRNGTIIKTSKVKLVNSRYQAEYRLPARGRYTVNASFAKDFDNLGNISPIKRFSTGS
jgi:beta propeller repeat protein